MRLPARYRLKAFPFDKRLWKVDWFGDLLKNPNAGSEPLLEVFIVPSKRNEITNEYLRQKSSYEYSQARKINVGVSLLPFLHIGTFWSDGIHQTAALSDRVMLWNLQINADSARIVNPLRFQAKNELFNYFPSIDRCPETNFIEIDFPGKNEKKILIPCYEIIRFYFAGSSNLTRSIITGGIRNSPNALFDETQTKVNAETGSANLILRDKMAGTDRHTIARLAFSQIANNAAWSVYSGIVKNYNNKGRRIVEAAFPFVGSTNLQVCGKWFKEGEVWHFLVYFIESCSHPLPYKQLAWGIEGEREISTADEGTKKEHWINRTDNKNTDEQIVGSDDEPALNTIFAEALFDGQKFTDLQNKESETRLKAAEVEGGNFRYRLVTDKTDEKRELSTAEGTSGTSEKRGLDIKIGEDEKFNKETEDAPKIIPAGWKLFNDILAELEKDAAIKTRNLSFQNEADSFSRLTQPEGIYFPCVINGKTASWAFLDEERSKRRQAMLAEINNNGSIHYLLDTEVDVNNKSDRYSMLFISSEEYKFLNEQFWITLFSECVKNRGKRRDCWSWNKIKRSSVRHDLKEIAKYVARIKDLFAE